MAFCTHCGRRLPDNATTCAGCGSPVSEPADAGDLGQIEDLAQTGQKIDAIKAYRELTGASLSEANEAVEEWLRTGAWPDVPPARTASLSEQVQQLLREGRKIEAIRVYRQQSGVSLAEAKQAVERWLKGEGLPPAGGSGSGSGCGLSVLCFLAISAVTLLSMQAGLFILQR